MTMTSARVSYLYDLMDSAYDAAAIAAQSVSLGHVPLIDRNFRAQHEAKTECAEEVARMKFIHLPTRMTCSMTSAPWSNASTDD